MFWRLPGSRVVHERGFLDEPSASALRDVVTRIYAFLETATIADAVLLKNFREWDGVQFSGLAAVLDSAAPDLAASFRRACAQVEANLAERYRPSPFKRWKLMPDRSYFRRHRDTNGYVPWHIDADAAALSVMESVNVWVPLTAVGVQAPSLEFIPGSSRVMRKLPLMKPENAFRADDWVREQFGPERWSPLVSLGDAVVFDHYTLHRTQPLPLEAARRLSCEFRFGPA